MKLAIPDVPAVTSDAAVIAASRSDPERFGAVFDKHAPLIHRYISRRTGCEVAEDLVAETFLAAFRRRERYDTTRPDARPWLYGIATKLISQHRREEIRQLRAQQAAIAELDDPDHSDDVAASVVASGVRGLLCDALAGLKDADRDVLVLIAWEQLSYSQVAQALDIPVGTVRSRLSRARTQLRAALAGTASIETEWRS